MITKSNVELRRQAGEKLRIIEYSRERFFREGFYKTTVDEIARGLSVSKNTFYKHFSNKEQLVLEVFMSIVGTLSGEVEKIVNSNDNAVQKFVTLIHTMAAYLIAISDRLFRDLQLHTPQIWKKVDEMRKEVMFRNLGRLIDQGIKEGLFHDYPPIIMQTVFISSLRSVMNPEFLMNNSISKEEAIRYTFGLLLGGSLTPKGLEIFKELKLPQ